MPDSKSKPPPQGDASAAQLRKTRRALDQLRKERSALIGELQDRWAEITGGDWHPSASFLHQLLITFSSESVAYAIEVTAEKLAGGYLNSESWAQYLPAVARNVTSERRQYKEAR
jgi:hypothetical protein